MKLVAGLLSIPNGLYKDIYSVWLICYTEQYLVDLFVFITTPVGPSIYASPIDSNNSTPDDVISTDFVSKIINKCIRKFIFSAQWSTYIK
jgi:hypothetical protein